MSSIAADFAEHAAGKASHLFPDPRARNIVDLHVWAMGEGLRGATAGELFDGYCQRLVIGGMALQRAHVSTQTLHPQWSGYGYTWRRDLNSVHYQQFPRGPSSSIWLESPFYAVISRAREGEMNPYLRRRLELGPEQRDFPALREFHEAGATDYICTVYTFGERGDPAHGTGVVYSFATDRPGGFDETEIELLKSTLPGLSLAIKAHAGHEIASSLLQTYLGEDAGKRVHSGAVERGSVNGLSAVLWYADMRGFTRVSDASPGSHIIEMLDDIFETLTAALRPRGGQVLKFIGDAMLATLAFDEADQAETCRRALDAAVEAMKAIEARNAERAAAGLPFVGVDLALHVGRGALRQCRRGRSARFHRDRPGGQRSRAHREALRTAGPARADVVAHSPRRRAIATAGSSGSAVSNCAAWRKPRRSSGWSPSARRKRRRPEGGERARPLKISRGARPTRRGSGLACPLAPRADRRSHRETYFFSQAWKRASLQGSESSGRCAFMQALMRPFPGGTSAQKRAMSGLQAPSTARAAAVCA